ncbi:MAG: M48 family metallopeptidase [Fluviicola sp.]|nr:M48 family metallopeptidase [Fluviicola sp.]
MKISFLVSLVLLCSLSVLYGQTTVDALRFEPALDTADKEVLLDLLQSEYNKQLDLLADEELTLQQRSVLRKAYGERYAAGKSLIKSDKAILSGPLFDSVNIIFTQILASNHELDQSSKLVLFRHCVFNAFTLGDNIIFVNIGLLTRLSNKEQLAFVIAHELSHNLRKHSQQKILTNVRRQTDTQLNDEINRIQRQEYGQVTALNELLLPSIYAEREQSRLHEFEADSLGLECYRAAGYSPALAFNLFEIMQVADHLYETELLPVFSLLKIDSLGTIAQRYKRYSPVSSLGTFAEEEDEYEPYLRSHPYEAERTNALLRQLGVDEIDTIVLADTAYMRMRYLADGEMIHSSIADGNFSEGIYFALRMQQHYPQDLYPKAALACMFNLLSFYKTTRAAGKHIDLQNPKNDEAADRLNYLLQVLNPQECLQIGQVLRSDIPPTYQNVLVELNDLANEFNLKNIDTYLLRREALLPQVMKTPFGAYLEDLQEKYYQQKHIIKNK